MHHDEFSELRQQMARGGLQQLAAGTPAADILAAAARATYNYVSHHRLDFPKLIANSTKTVRSEHAADTFGREHTAILCE